MTSKKRKAREEHQEKRTWYLEPRNLQTLKKFRPPNERWHAKVQTNVGVRYLLIETSREELEMLKHSDETWLEFYAFSKRPHGAICYERELSMPSGPAL